MPGLLQQLVVLFYKALGLVFRALFMIKTKLRLPSKRDRRQRAVLGLLAMFMTYYMYQTLTMPVRFLFTNDNVNKQCIIPDLDPFDKSIMKYVWSPEPIQCSPVPDLLFVDEKGVLQLNQSALSKLGRISIKCSYQLLKRNDDYSVYFEDEVVFEPPLVIPADFFRVTCRDIKHRVIYDNLHESVYSELVIDNKVLKSEDESHYSLFLFGIDSTSRLSAIRKLKKTYSYLTESLDAIVYKGYMKIADNTFPNLLPILTGKVAWSGDLPKVNYKNFHIDSLVNFIWKNFSDANYATLFAEDYPDLATFDIEAGGFKEQPTDHYMRTWMLGMKKFGFATEVLKSVLLPFEYNNMNLKGTSSLCFGNKPVHRHLINYYKRFVSQYSGKRRFAFSWLTQICHEFINYLELGDDDFLDLFKFMKENGHLKNAFLVFFSDHGSRIDDIRNTFVGRIEERMPLLAIVPPENFHTRYSQAMHNVKKNADKLTSNLDFHETVTDILHNYFIPDDKLTYTNTPTKGTSFFKDIPTTRSCADASIPEHFCACYGATNISPTDNVVQQAAKFAVSHLNLILTNYRDICAELFLHRVHEAQQISLGLSARGEEENRWTVYKFISKPEEEKHKRYLVIFETVPGNAMFEATVDYHVDTGMDVLDDVSRTNKYGNTSKCVPEKPLQRYCYCNSNLKQ